MDMLPIITVQLIPIMVIIMAFCAFSKKQALEVHESNKTWKQTRGGRLEKVINKIELNTKIAEK